MYSIFVFDEQRVRTVAHYAADLSFCLYPYAPDIVSETLLTLKRYMTETDIKEFVRKRDSVG